MTELILYNGKLTTQDPNIPRATALAIANQRILTVGTDADVRALTRRGSREIDLGGRRVLPGLIDSHFHYWHWAHSRRWIDLADTDSLDALCRAGSAGGEQDATWAMDFGSKLE